MSILVSIIAIIVFLYFGYLKLIPKESPLLKYQNYILIILSLISISSYLNWGNFHGTTQKKKVLVLHPHDAFHYMLGSKYFNEVGYSNLYQAAFLAENESEVSLDLSNIYVRRMTDYRLIKAHDILKDKNEVKALFSPERWKSFKHDVIVFKRYMEEYDLGAEGFSLIYQDHGFNGSPLYVTVSQPILNQIPISSKTLFIFSLFDFALIGILIAIITRYFNIQTAACFIALFCFCHPSRYEWIGGGFLRFMSLTTIGFGLVLLKNRKPSASFFLSIAVFLRVFPIFTFIGIGINSLWILLKRTENYRDDFKFILKLGLTSAFSVLVLFSITYIQFGGIEPYKEWSKRLKTHSSYISANAIGLPSLLAYKSDYCSDNMIIHYYNLYKDTERCLKDGKEPSISGFIGSNRAAIVASRSIYGFIFMAIVWILFTLTSRKLTILASAIFGLSFLFMSSLNLSGYYASILAFIPLAFFESDKFRSNAFGYFTTALFLFTFICQKVWNIYHPSLDVQSFFESLSIIICVLVTYLLYLQSQKIGASRSEQDVL